MDGSSGYLMPTSEWTTGAGSSQGTVISYPSPVTSLPSIAGSPTITTQSGPPSGYPDDRSGTPRASRSESQMLTSDTYQGMYSPQTSPHPYDAQRTYASRTPGPAPHSSPTSYVMDPRMNWQAAQPGERASVRLATRSSSSQPQQPQMIPLQYPQYYPPSIAFLPYPPQIYQTQSTKRAPEYDEEEVAAPKKKSRTVRTKADGTPSMYFRSQLLMIPVNPIS
jgi:hypothetical protein